ncbi:MAG: hypothetical protein U9M92_00040 [Patescibacteria group bacterium]|nr:hypothetical protein [Patescibacteria group bacterium]
MTSISRTIKYDNVTNYRRAVLVLTALFVLLVAWYIYLVNSTIFGAVSRERQLGVLADLQSEVVALEGDYLGLANNISLEHARTLGFQDVDSKTLIASDYEAEKLAQASL